MENLGMRTLTYREGRWLFWIDHSMTISYINLLTGIEIQVETIKSIEHNYPDNYRRVFVVNGKSIDFYLCISFITSFLRSSSIEFMKWRAKKENLVDFGKKTIPIFEKDQA